MVQEYQTNCIFLLICGLLVAISLFLVGVPDVQAQASNSCPEGQIWSLNRCTDVEETTCQSGYTYVADNDCVLIEEDASACPSGYEMTGGRCQVIGQSCPAGEVWRDGSCQVRDEESCPAGQERVNGSCFQITDTVCPVGYSWSDSRNKCVDNNDEDEDDSESGTGESTGTSNVVYSILILSDTTLTVDEGCNGTYTVALRREPSDDVTVTIGDPSNTDVTAEPATLSFTPDNWDEPQTVTVTCHEDDDAVDDEATVTHTVDRPDLESVVDEDLDIHVTDNDEAGVTISESSFNVDEVCHETYTIQLDSKPTANVTVTIGDPSNTAVTAEPATLTFTPDNWGDPQTVTVTCVEDDNAVNEESLVTHTVSGGDYAGISTPGVTFKVTDNDTRGVTISESSFNVNEVCHETYTIQLDSQPTANVTVNIFDPANNAVTTAPATLTFTPDNWGNPQTVTVTCVEDDNGVNEESIVIHVVGGGDYDCISTPSVTFKVTDNDTAGVTLSKSSLNIYEGDIENYSIQLDTEPTGRVTVTIHDPIDNTDVTTDPVTLTFTTLNWQDPQTVTVTAREDDDAGGSGATVTHSVSGADYGSVTAVNVTVTVTDNDTRGVTLSEPDVTVYEGGTGTYAVQLDTEPTGNVTVTIHDPTNKTEVTTDPATLTFTTLNWKNPQTVTVTVQEDEDAVDNWVFVTHSVSGADYAGVSASDVTVKVTDNDRAGVFISPVFHTVVDVCDYTYTVTLLTEPTGDVTVTIHDPIDNTDVTTEPAALTFTPDNWDEEQYVTVTCTADDDDEVDRAYVSHTVRGGGYGGFNAPDVYITVYDTDIAGVTLSESSLEIGEGGTGTYTVQLDTEPTGTVTVTIHDPINTDVTTDPATLAFTPDNWDYSQTVTITAAEDGDVVDDTATVTHSVSRGDYRSVIVDDVIVTVTEPDPNALPTYDEDTIDELFVAIEDDEVDTVNRLLNDIGFPDFLDEGKSALFYAVEEESPNVFDALLGHADVDPNVANGNGQTTLFQAVQFGQREYIEKLLDHSDTDPNAFSAVLHVSILTSRQQDILKMMLAHPDIDPNQQASDSRKTPLHMAVQYNSTCSAILLIAHPDIDPSIEDIDGRTPLERARFLPDREEMVELLEAYEAE